jgi:hypothetical protein
MEQSLAPYRAEDVKRVADSLRTGRRGGPSTGLLPESASTVPVPGLDVRGMFGLPARVAGRKGAAFWEGRAALVGTRYALQGWGGRS